jgi:hypothetical protein
MLPYLWEKEKSRTRNVKPHRTPHNNTTKKPAAGSLSLGPLPSYDRK